MAQHLAHFEHKSTQPEAAAAFYEGLLPWRVGAPEAGLLPLLAPEGQVGAFRALPPPLVAQGVPAHWLPQLLVPELLQAVAAHEGEGFTRLGPPLGPESRQALLREPWGSVVGLLQAQADGPQGPLAGVWPLLNCVDEGVAAEAYRGLWGWSLGELLPMGPSPFPLQLMQAEGAERPVAGLMPTATLPGIHPHWLPIFLVEELAAALALAQAKGAKLAKAPGAMAVVGQMAYLEDPWGAAFGLGASQA